MKFEHATSVPQAFIESTRKKIERAGLEMPITPEELEQECEGDPRCEKALSEMYKYAFRYAADVWNMKELVIKKKEYDEEEWAEMLAKADSDRTKLHDTYIESIAILSRALLAAEKDISWVRQLAPTGKLERAACGKFAIMLTYMSHVNSVAAE